MTQRTTAAAEARVAKEERREAQRLKIPRQVLIRPCDPKYKEEVHTTLNISRQGLYFTTSKNYYYVGMHVSVVVGYAPCDPCNLLSSGKIVRIDRDNDGNYRIAVQIFMR